MSVGSQYRFVMPADLAFGDRGAGTEIGPGDTLILDRAARDQLELSSSGLRHTMSAIVNGNERSRLPVA